MGWPTSPTTGQIYQNTTRTWQWNGVAWELVKLSSSMLMLYVYTTLASDPVDFATVNYV